MASQLTAKLKELSVLRALSFTIKSINLKNVKSVKFRFNPFEDNVGSIRDTMFQFSANKHRQTNANCLMKADVRSDRGDPEMEVLFIDGHRAVFRTKFLTTVDILQNFNRLCQLHEPKQSSKK